MCLAGLQHRRTGVIVGHRTPGNRIKLRQALLPVTSELFHLHKIGLIPGFKLIRPGTHRMEADIFTVFLQRRRRYHCRCRVRQDINKRRERLFQRDLHRRRINGLGVSDIFIQVIAFKMIFRIAGSLKVSFHRLCIEIGAILKLHPLPQFDGIG
ncbi:hypothetical protein D3C73_923390 [compost metagenome]